MARTEGFWSYVQIDDDAETGRISQLARDVQNEYGLLTGEELNLFLDRDALGWGDRWKDRIDESLANVTFFVPVLTPRYFKSAECRREFQLFARRAERFGVLETVMPIAYAKVAELAADDPGDDLVAKVKEFQWVDWTDLRFEDRGSGSYRRAVSRLAEDLMRANQAAESADVASVIQSVEEATPAEPEGYVDRLAASEAALPKWSDTMTALSSEIGNVSHLFGAATSEMQAQDAGGGGFAGRLLVTKRLARELQEPAARILDLGSDFVSHMHDVDAGVRVLLARLPAEAADDSEAREVTCGFLESLRSLVNSTHEGIRALESMISEMTPIEEASTDLRQPMRVMRKGLTAMLEANAVADDWLELVESSPIDCDEEDATAQGHATES